MMDKGREFKGLAGGANYKRWAGLLGMGDTFYQRGIGSIELTQDMKALDLGCGPGALSFALARKAHPSAVIHGIDISTDQLAYAKKHSAEFSCSLEFQKHSMDALPFPDAHFDLVMSSMALHETPPWVRRAAVAETARVLKTGGLFLFIDWSRPKFGLKALIWLPFVLFREKNKDNWNNVYPALCRQHGLELEDDAFLDSMSRRQVFRKS